MKLVARVEDIPAEPGSVVFVIGENLKRFERKKNVAYVFLNFSVVSILGNPFALSLSGLHLIRRKQRLLREKLELFDIILDFYPAQTRYLQTKLLTPVLGFLPCVDPKHIPVPHGDQRYDVAFVGGASRRRQRVLEAIQRQGFTISPNKNVVLEEVASKSSICINIHMQRSSHLEIPRIVGSLAAGCPVITELSHGANEVFPTDVLRSASARKIPGTVAALLRNPTALGELRARSSAWYRSEFLPSASQLWSETIQQIKERKFPNSAV